MRRNTVVSAPRRARIDAPGVASETATADTHRDGNRRAYYTALGKLALENMRSTLGWWLDTLRFPSDRNRGEDVRNPPGHWHP
jgi:hypothetical protein